MRLTRLRLRNWKAFRSLDLEFRLLKNRNVFIIEGSNGFGKTSLLEAIILALYGREGVALVGRASSRGRAELGYDAFLERALHQPVRGSDASASVELSFEGECADEQVTLQRIWYFNPAGRHRKADEELRLWTGADDDLLILSDGPEREVEAREFVGRALLPARLASFFLFDGEHLDRLAGRDLDQQVRLGLEHALGIPVLRRLGEDLKSYARDRRRQLAGTAGAEIGMLIETVAGHEREQKRLRADLEQVSQKLVPLREERDSIVGRIGSLHGESYESFKLLFEERERRARTRDGLQDRLRQKLSFDLALALAGPSLRTAAREAIARDTALAQSTATRAAGAGRYDALVAMIGDPDSLAAAGLSPAQWQAFEPRLREAWAQIWADGSHGGEPVHNHLGESDRLLVEERLRQIEAFGVEAIAELAHEAEAADGVVAGIDRQIADQRGIDDISQQLADRLRETQEEITSLEERARSLPRTGAGASISCGTTGRRASATSTPLSRGRRNAPPTAGWCSPRGHADGRRGSSAAIDRQSSGGRLDADEWTVLMDIHLRYGDGASELRSSELEQAASILFAMAARRGKPREGAELRSVHGLNRRLTELRALDRGESRNSRREARKVWMRYRQQPRDCALRAASILEREGRERHVLDDGPLAGTRSHGPAPSFGNFISARADGETLVYCLELSGTGEAAAFLARFAAPILKLGRTNDPDRRIAELNQGFPPRLGLEWRLAFLRPCADGSAAHAIEQATLDWCEANGLCVGGEFLCDAADEIVEYLATLPEPTPCASGIPARSARLRRNAASSSGSRAPNCIKEARTL